MLLEGRCSARVASVIGAASTALRGLGDPIFSVARLDGEPHSRQLARWRAQEVSASTTHYQNILSNSTINNINVKLQ